jgi:site-specific DNA recombinase
VYVRISEDRAGAGLGVERQRQDCDALAERLGWQVVGTYVDNDVSAFSGKLRPQYRQLLSDLEGGRADGVLAWHTDRLHRSPLELEEYVDVCDRRGVVTQTVQAGELDLSTPSGRMVARMLGASARYEVEHKSERTKRAHLQAAQQGRWRGGARPFGYEADGVTVRDDEAAELRRLVSAVLDGQTLGSLARDLNARGVTSTTGRPWEFTTLRQLLLRPRNAGLSTYRGEVIGMGKWPALVPETTWRQLVDVLKAPERRTSSVNALRWMLAGIARCGACGRPVRSGTAVSNARTGTKRTVYRCGGEGVGHVARAAEPVDRFVTDVVLARLALPDAADLLAGEGAGLAELQEQAAGLRARLEGLAELYADGALTNEQLATATKRIRGRLADVEAATAVARRHPVAAKLLGPGDLRAHWEALPVTDRRDVVDLLLEVRLLPQGKRGTAFDPTTVQIEWRTS